MSAPRPYTAVRRSPVAPQRSNDGYLPVHNGADQEANNGSFWRPDFGQAGRAAGGAVERTLGALSSRRPSVSEKTPTRSFYHRSFHGSLGAGQYSLQGVHDQTAEIESLALSEETESLPGTSAPEYLYDYPSPPANVDSNEQTLSQHDRLAPIDGRVESQFSRPPSRSALTAMLHNSPPAEESETRDSQEDLLRVPSTQSAPTFDHIAPDESSPLVRRISSQSRKSGTYGSADTETGTIRKGSLPPTATLGEYHPKKRFDWKNLSPKTWDRETVWQKGVVYPVSLLPSVFLGLLLNILDALSYGMILFPLGEPMFAQMGSDGISMFYVSTIIAQLVYSCGGSIFKGGVGAEMIEVVPFFHRMALMVLARVGEDNPASVFATTILSFAMSAVLTGAVFFAMGASGLGSLIGFFPRHILIGCIGGVGFFLIATGVEISARLSGNLEYTMETLQKLFQLDTVFLWTTPLIIAIAFLVVKRFVKSSYLVGGYFLFIAALFYFFKLVLHIPLPTLRDQGWIFDAPSASVPWYHFYTLYDFSAVNWSALADTIPTMFALTFFGILHVPINVPALGISTGEDQLNVDRELIAHGISNALSGVAGSIQNYLVYTNSLLFIASGGDRLAGIMLAFATFGVLLAGPTIVGYIPIMVVGGLIFMMGIELMEEALVDTWGKLDRLEYITVVIIVVTMGAWDFVTGIVAGIILACVNFVAQTSQKSAITGTYTGEVASSTVRRHPIHVKFLREAGRQTYVIKLGGILFFGTIVSVEKRIRWLIEGEMFNKRPIRFLVLDLSFVNGLDFSAAEALTRLNRIVRKRTVHMILCGVDLNGGVGKGLRNVGLFEEPNQVELFEDLNSALEFCENELLKALHDGRNALTARNGLQVPASHPPPPAQDDDSSQQQPQQQQQQEQEQQEQQQQLQPPLTDTLYNSPRRFYLNQVAASTLRDEAAEGSSSQAKSSTVAARHHPQPLATLLLTVQSLSSKPDEFWALACPFFTRSEHASSSVLYRSGDAPCDFFLLESGMLRAEYEMPQGRYFELIVAGRPCGELPFFGETKRTATVRAERDCVVWSMSRDGWERLRSQHPAVATELFKVCLKLTAERMDSITSYVMTATR